MFEGKLHSTLWVCLVLWYSVFSENFGTLLKVLFGLLDFALGPSANYYHTNFIFYAPGLVLRPDSDLSQCRMGLGSSVEKTSPKCKKGEHQNHSQSVLSGSFFKLQAEQSFLFHTQETQNSSNHPYVENLEVSLITLVKRHFQFSIKN